MIAGGLAASFLLLVLWLTATVRLVRMAPSDGSDRGLSLRRVGVLALCVAAGVGGCWGPAVHRSTETNVSPAPSGQVAETVRMGFRTPALVATRTMDVAFEGEVVRDVWIRTIQVPLSLLMVLGWAGWSSVGRFRFRGRAMCLGAALAAVVGACVGETVPVDRPDRTIFETAWDTLVLVESLPEDTVFLSVRRVAADSFGIRVLDGPGRRVVMVAWDGSVQWYAGRSGSGPGELQDPRAISLDGAGGTWVMDVGNHRINGFDRFGRAIDEVPLFEIDFVPHELAVDASADRFYVVDASSGIRPVEVRRNGSARAGRRVRVPDASGAPSLALQGDVRSLPGTDRWVFALSMGDGFVRFDGLEPWGPFVHYVEHVPFPTVEVTVDEDRAAGTRSRTQRIVSPIFASQGAALTASRILVPFGGTGPLRDVLLDIYASDDGAYRGSLVLPTPGRIATWDELLVLARNAPHPHIVVIRPERWP